MGRYYAEANSRSNLRGGVSGMYSLGDIASDPVTAAVQAAGPNAKLEGDGTAANPFGGMGGAWGNSSSGALAEKVLVQLTRRGIRFSALKTEDGLAWLAIGVPATTQGEKYVYVTGSDGKFYKFRVNGSSFGRNTSNDKARYWFNDVVTAAKKQVASELMAKQLKEATKEATRKAAIEVVKSKRKAKAKADAARSGFTPDGLQLLQTTAQDGESSLSTTGDGGGGGGGGGDGGGDGGGGSKLLLIGGAVAAVAVLYMFSRKG